MWESKTPTRYEKSIVIETDRINPTLLRILSVAGRAPPVDGKYLATYGIILITLLKSSDSGNED